MAHKKRPKPTPPSPSASQGTSSPPKEPAQKRGTGDGYGNHIPGNVLRAAAAYLRGEGSTGHLALRYGVPKSTLIDRIAKAKADSHTSADLLLLLPPAPAAAAPATAPPATAPPHVELVGPPPPRAGRKTVLTSEEEAALVAKILHYHDVHMSLDRKQVCMGMVIAHGQI